MHCFESEEPLVMAVPSSIYLLRRIFKCSRYPVLSLTRVFRRDRPADLGGEKRTPWRFRKQLFVLSALVWTELFDSWCDRTAGWQGGDPELGRLTWNSPTGSFSTSSGRPPRLFYPLHTAITCPLQVYTGGSQPAHLRTIHQLLVVFPH